MGKRARISIVLAGESEEPVAKKPRPPWVSSDTNVNVLLPNQDDFILEDWIVGACPPYVERETGEVWQLWQHKKDGWSWWWNGSKWWED